MQYKYYPGLKFFSETQLKLVANEDSTTIASSQRELLARINAFSEFHAGIHDHDLAYADRPMKNNKIVKGQCSTQREGKQSQIIDLTRDGSCESGATLPGTRAATDAEVYRVTDIIMDISPFPEERYCMESMYAYDGNKSTKTSQINLCEQGVQHGSVTKKSGQLLRNSTLIITFMFLASITPTKRKLSLSEEDLYHSIAKMKIADIIDCDEVKKGQRNTAE